MSYKIFQLIKEETHVQLKSYSKKPESNGNLLQEQKNTINVSSMVAKTPSPKTRKRNENNKQPLGNGNVQPLNSMDATNGENRYKRISMLAESVFGDKIVQQGGSSAPGHRSRKESSVEGVSMQIFL